MPEKAELAKWLDARLDGLMSATEDLEFAIADIREEAVAIHKYLKRLEEEAKHDREV